MRPPQCYLRCGVYGQEAGHWSQPGFKAWLCSLWQVILPPCARFPRLYCEDGRVILMNESVSVGVLEESLALSAR